MISTTTTNKPTYSSEQLAKITELAYYRAEKRGFQPGHEHEDWLDAEREFNLYHRADNSISVVTSTELTIEAQTDCQPCCPDESLSELMSTDPCQAKQANQHDSIAVSEAKPLSGVAKYLTKLTKNQADTPVITLTGVEKYLAKQKHAAASEPASSIAPLSKVEQYLANRRLSNSSPNDREKSK